MKGAYTYAAQDEYLAIPVAASVSQVARVQITGVWTGTINVRGSVDGVNYDNLLVEREVDAVVLTDITANGIYLINLSGFQAADVYLTTLGSGDPVATYGLVEGSTSPRSITVDLTGGPPTIGAVTLKDAATATEAKVAAGTAITLAHNAVAVKDAALGLKTDVAVTDSATDSTAISWLRGTVKILADAWDAVNHKINVSDALAQVAIADVETAVAAVETEAALTTTAANDTKAAVDLVTTAVNSTKSAVDLTTVAVDAATAAVVATAKSPTTFVPLAAVAIGSEATIWTPAAGKKFRLMGMTISVGTAAGNVVLKDNTAGTVIAIIPKTAVDTPITLNFGNGILSAVADNVLTADGAATATISGTVFGTEE